MTAADRWLPFLHEIADEADGIALRHFRSEGLRVDLKSNSSPVTAADREIEDAARAFLRREHPELGILGEERGEEKGSSGARLIIDPIDATKNFIRGIPLFATLLAIEEGAEVVSGVVSAPALRTRWHVARGSGAYRGDVRLRVSSVPALEESLIFHGGLKDDAGAFVSEGWAAVFDRAGRTRGFGDFYQHVLVAEGAGEMAFDPKLNPWDIAPLVLLVEEAGGRVSSIAGERSIYSGSLISSNGLVHDEVLGLLAPRAAHGAALNVYVLCGLAFAGKTAVASAIRKVHGATVISLDALNAARGLHGGLGIPVEEWERSYHEALALLEDALGAGRDAVIDDTGCFRSLRDGYRDVADRFGAETTILYLECAPELALGRLRDNARAPTRGPVSEPVMLELIRKFEPPGADERALTVPAECDVEEWVTRHLPVRPGEAP